jgi:hypothetical protein
MAGAAAFTSVAGATTTSARSCLTTSRSPKPTTAAGAGRAGQAAQLAAGLLSAGRISQMSVFLHQQA